MGDEGAQDKHLTASEPDTKEKAGDPSNEADHEDSKMQDESAPQEKSALC